MKNPTPRPNMAPTTRLAALGIGTIALIDAMHGINTLGNDISRSNEIAGHIKNPKTIPVSERLDVGVPTGSNASTLSEKLAPNSSSDQASLFGELSNQMHNGALEGTVHVDKSLVEVDPAGVKLVDPASDQVVHLPEAK